MTTMQSAGGPGTMPVSLAQRAATSRFKDLFREGMGLVEEVAAYLDGPGRAEAKTLSRQLAVAYAAESMRLTTRLMQIASWLLVQKAIVEGDLDRAQGILERNRVQLSSQGIATEAALFARLPDLLQDFTARSLTMQSRILRYEAQLHEPRTLVPFPGPTGLGIHSQFDLLHRSFAPVRRPS